MTAEAANDRVTLRYADAMLSFAYEKQVSLTGEAVRFQYAITNRGEAPMPCVWVCHCLLRLEPDCRFIFPQEGGVAENSIPGTALGGAGECHPLVGDGYDFSRPPVPQGALKFYLQAPVQDAHCAVLYPSQGIQTHLRWDGETLPYLGLLDYHGEPIVATVILPLSLQRHITTQWPAQRSMIDCPCWLREKQSASGWSFSRKKHNKKSKRRNTCSSSDASAFYSMLDSVRASR